MAAGNHEYSKYVGEATEDHAYKMSSYPSVQAAFGNDLLFASREINGLNLVAVDNTYYQFNSLQLALLKKEIEKGMPILMLVHNPFYTEELYDTMMNIRKQPCPYVVGCPEEKLSGCSQHRFALFYHWVGASPLITIVVTLWRTIHHRLKPPPLTNPLAEWVSSHFLFLHLEIL